MRALAGAQLDTDLKPSGPLSKPIADLFELGDHKSIASYITANKMLPASKPGWYP